MHSKHKNELIRCKYKKFSDKRNLKNCKNGYSYVIYLNQKNLSKKTSFEFE